MSYFAYALKHDYFLHPSATIKVYANHSSISTAVNTMLQTSALIVGKLRRSSDASSFLWMWLMVVLHRPRSEDRPQPSPLTCRLVSRVPDSTMCVTDRHGMAFPSTFRTNFLIRKRRRRTTLPTRALPCMRIHEHRKRTHAHLFLGPAPRNLPLRY